MKIKAFSISLLCIAFIYPLQTVYAQLGTLSPPTNATLDLGVNINRLINFAIGSGTVVFLYMFVRGAIEWVLSEGDKMHLQTARNRMTQAGIGLVLLGVTFGIANLVRAITYTK